MSIPVRISFYSSGDGEQYLFDTVLDRLDGSSVIKSILKHDSEFGDVSRDKHELIAFHTQGSESAFIISSYDPVYFGHTLITGVVYTRFAGSVTRT